MRTLPLPQPQVKDIRVKYCKAHEKHEIMRFDGIQEGINKNYEVWTCVRTGHTRLYKVEGKDELQ